MGPAPIPPHERSWRHPSELAPTAPAYADDRPGSRWSLALATGAVAVAVVAVFAITTTPSRTTGPVAMSATTLPAYSVAPVGVSGPATSEPAGTADDPAAPTADTSEASFDSVRLAQPLLSNSSGLAIAGAPKTVAAPVPLDPTPAPAELDRVTDPSMAVHLITESHVYRLSFGDLERVLAPDGSIVVDADGLLLGWFENGRFVAD